MSQRGRREANSSNSDQVQQQSHAKKLSSTSSSDDRSRRVEETIAFLKDIARQMTEIEEDEEMSQAGEDSCTQIHQQHGFDREDDWSEGESAATQLAGNDAAEQKKCKEVFQGLQSAIKKEVHKLAPLLAAKGRGSKEPKAGNSSSKVENRSEVKEQPYHPRKALTYNELKQLDSFAKCQKEFAELFFEQEPVFKQKFESLYGPKQEMVKQWQLAKAKWLELIVNIHEYFFKQREYSQMRFHFMRTFEFFVTKLVRSYKYNDMSQYLRKWLCVLPEKLIIFVFDYGYELVRKYHRVYLGYKMDEFLFSNERISLEAKADNIKEQEEEQFFAQNSGTYLLRKVLTSIQHKLESQHKYWNYKQTLIKLKNSRIGGLTCWYHDEEPVKCIQPFEGNLDLEANPALEQDFYDENEKQVCAFHDKVDAIHQEYVRLLQLRKEYQESRFMMAAAAASGIAKEERDSDSLKQRIEECHDKLESIWSSRVGESYALFPLLKEKKTTEAPQIELSYLSTIVLDKLVNAIIDGFASPSLICINGVVIEKNSPHRRFSEKDWTKLQMKLYYLPQLEELYADTSSSQAAAFQVEYPPLESSKNLKRKAGCVVINPANGGMVMEERIGLDLMRKKRLVEKHKKRSNSDGADDNDNNDAEDGLAVVTIISKISVGYLNEDQLREKQVEALIAGKKKQMQAALQSSYGSYNKLLEKVYAFLCSDINLCHLLYQYSPPDGLKYLQTTLPKLMEDYFFNSKTILYEHNLIQSACQAYTKRFDPEQQAQFEREQPALYTKMKEFYAKQLYTQQCEVYQLSQQQQREKHTHDLQQQLAFELSKHEIDIFCEYGLVAGDEGDAYESSSSLVYNGKNNKPLLAQFKEYIQHDSELLQTLSYCQYQSDGFVSEVFRKELNKYEQFRQQLATMSRQERKLTQLRCHPQYNVHQRIKKESMGLLARIDRLATVLEDSYGMIPPLLPHCHQQQRQQQQQQHKGVEEEELVIVKKKKSFIEEIIDLKRLSDLKKEKEKATAVNPYEKYPTCYLEQELPKLNRRINLHELELKRNQRTLSKLEDLEWRQSVQEEENNCVWNRTPLISNRCDFISIVLGTMPRPPLLPKVYSQGYLKLLKDIAVVKERINVLQADAMQIEALKQSREQLAFVLTRKRGNRQLAAASALGEKGESVSVSSPNKSSSSIKPFSFQQAYEDEVFYTEQLPFPSRAHLALEYESGNPPSEIQRRYFNNNNKQECCSQGDSSCQFDGTPPIYVLNNPSSTNNKQQQVRHELKRQLKQLLLTEQQQQHLKSNDVQQASGSLEEEDIEVQCIGDYEENCHYSTYYGCEGGDDEAEEMIAQVVQVGEL